jgi:hypothetical protein
MVDGGVGADDEDHLGVGDVAHLVRDGAGVDASISAATLEAWHSRVQWSTLLQPKPVRTSFWKR